jgi:hypothetical protein
VVDFGLLGLAFQGKKISCVMVDTDGSYISPIGFQPSLSVDRSPAHRRLSDLQEHHEGSRARPRGLTEARGRRGEPQSAVIVGGDDGSLS